jgi:hypothetical protein
VQDLDRLHVQMEVAHTDYSKANAELLALLQQQSTTSEEGMVAIRHAAFKAARALQFHDEVVVRYRVALDERRKAVFGY